MGRKSKALNVRKKRSQKPNQSLAAAPSQPGNLAKEHNQMLEQLKMLPPYPHDTLLTPNQITQITNTQNFWYWVTGRIDWLQKEQLGFCLPDPLDHPKISDFQLWHWQLNVTSRYHFAQLQICIAGWNLIKRAAETNQREFPFNNSRSLFATVLLQQKESEISDILNGSEGGLEEQRANLRIRSHFYRDRLPAEDSCKLLKTHQESSQWWNFIIYGIWEKRDSSYRKLPSSPTMRETWQGFLKAHKDFTSFWCNKKAVGNYRLHMISWREGQGFDPKTNQRIWQCN
jgi:hypothetical protein